MSNNSAVEGAIILLDAATSTGTGARIGFPGKYNWTAQAGSWSGATVTLEMLLPDGSTYVSCGTDGAFTANGTINVDLPVCTVRASISGGPPTSVTATLRRIG